MSKIAELLKLAEQKKENKPQPELVPTTSIIETEFTNKNKIEEVGVSKGKQEEVRVSKGKQKELSATKSKHVEIEVSKSNEQPEVKTNPVNRTQAKSVNVSPVRDFTKVSNSITKRAIPEKYFRGLSKHT